MLVVALVAVILLSHFGGINPNPLGLISGVYVYLLCVSLLWLVGGRRRWVDEALSYVVVVFCLLITLFNWWYFQYFQSYFNYEALALVGAAPEALKSASQFEYTRAAITISIASLLPLVLARVLGLPLIPRSHRLRRVGAISVVM